MTPSQSKSTARGWKGAESVDVEMIDNLATNRKSGWLEQLFRKTSGSGAKYIFVFGVGLGLPLPASPRQEPGPPNYPVPSERGLVWSGTVQ